MKILTFGEVLWDVFGEQKKIGGAPLNFSAHLRKLGADVTFVSAVGGDPLGRETLSAVKGLGLPTDHVAVLPDVPTGYCAVTLTDGVPHYELARNVAYDFIPFAEGLLSRRFDAFYLGTLASRSPVSEATCARFLRECGAKEVFFDVNIRGNDWSEEGLKRVLPHTTLLKCSREELYAFGAEAKDGERLCRSLCKDYPNLKQVILTLDKDGAETYLPASDRFLYAPKPTSKPVSTVGAGDSFSACYLYNTLAGASPEDCLARAVTLSDFVVTQLEAVPDYPDGLLEIVRSRGER